MPASGSNWFYNPNTSRGYRAAAWAVAIVGVVSGFRSDQNVPSCWRPLNRWRVSRCFTS